jgi:hypothetical protein
MSIREIWYKFLAAMARDEDRAHGLDNTPLATRDIEPHLDAKNVHDESHLWKTHGGGHH